MSEVVEMSNKELHRYNIVQKVIEKQITQKKAAELLSLKSDRQVRNLIARFIKDGAPGVKIKTKRKTQ
jgi:hypothetical protein